ncbi:uncharacterized protein B0I36DRAFT_160091 [Microdochium trichocladiopsis]|uniref:Uncharacterized protein n=1 Tax=Microdochium trichocladiopsis TaxID=1682393 RepID=A0A9P8Y1Y2_9PEZI|nr:uncharacterized protein B0I36DRAFT_160091 [Microdochium trichocladiopsis]KAH7026566.1 hypothetical protein B0I36DRAFT_160091 [Microdochium trichocladiopsis]
MPTTDTHSLAHDAVGCRSENPSKATIARVLGWEGIAIHCRVRPSWRALFPQRGRDPCWWLMTIMSGPWRAARTRRMKEPRLQIEGEVRSRTTPYRWRQASAAHGRHLLAIGHLSGQARVEVVERHGSRLPDISQGLPPAASRSDLGQSCRAWLPLARAWDA